jgi:hypothetical protein
MQPHGSAFENRTIPYRRHDFASLGLAKQMNHIFNDLHLTPVREDRVKILIRGLKQAKGGIRSTVNDLDIFHCHMMHGPDRACNGARLFAFKQHIAAAL